MDNEAKKLYRVVAACVLIWIAVIALLVSFAPTAQASPVDYVFVVDEPLPALNDGFARVETPMPLGATIADVQVIKTLSSSMRSTGMAARIYYIADPDAPMVWRRIEFLQPVHPVTQPIENLIGVSAELVIFDGGQHAQPLP